MSLYFQPKMWIRQPASSLDEKQHKLQIFNGNRMENGMEMENGNGNRDYAFAKMQKTHGMRLLMFCDKKSVGLILSVLLKRVIEH